MARKDVPRPARRNKRPGGRRSLSHRERVRVEVQPPGRERMSRTSRSTRADYRFFHTIATRWKDNDVYGHVNNVEFYSYFDTAVNFHLVSRNVLDIAASTIV